MVGNFCLLSKYNAKWIIDSGAKDHICTNLDWFADYKTVDNQSNFITVPDGGKSVIQHVGTVTLSSDFDL